MTPGRFKTGALKLCALAAALALPVLAQAQETANHADPHRWQLNMAPGVTPTSHAAYDAHMIVLVICVVIGLIVFGAMAYAMFKFRKSKGAVPDTSFTHSTKLEAIWTALPILILIGLAFPATHGLMRQYDTRDSEMTVKVTGYQWMWKYEYLGQDVAFTSRLDRKSDEVRQSGVDARTANLPHYLLDVDNQLVLPVGVKIRFVLTADDVIHAWWVPALGWKQDAIPGIVNEAWAQIEKPGVYRGQCAELCGKDHGFMPIVVKAVPKAEFEQWLAAKKPAAPAEPAAEAAPEAPASTEQTDAAPAAAAAAPQTEQAPANAAAAG
ncbi:cytochrome c oxidase subunit II [Thermomonas sp. HDW16]|uniref:cytochrome c oxidase subunit II n=1 Tax=Thermomonas sp. HDW16 TaxID=2714945 RepID=UPI001407B51A|nr:cytochrome c oxidase subunit II [Thermomonas sp. HDW16]QIL19655.1 cytochrome c oxidase subunit II [Thermomonas sp. HDW16]